MTRLRRKDVRAIAFCALSIATVFVIVFMIADRFLPQPIYAAPLGLTFALWLLTRARMMRVWRRLRGESPPGWGNYYRN